ncbi:MAG: pyridoxamine 5'-phosphate oxidase family protein [Candidatus Dormibacteraeota bacterium]|nr:pyridoxamine 5'-phosphate oxidase family protein [Candidatus Dormibacteraeota bacterium]
MGIDLTGSQDQLLQGVAQFIAAQQLAVVATRGPDGAPQAALVGIAITDRFELVFDSVQSSRKVLNIRRDSRVAVVVGGTMQDERTVQVDGVADEPTGDEGERVREAYFRRWPDGRERQSWAGITYVRITPQWLRFSDWTVSPAVVAEWVRGEELLQRRA